MFVFAGPQFSIDEFIYRFYSCTFSSTNREQNSMKHDSLHWQEQYTVFHLQSDFIEIMIFNDFEIVKKKKTLFL